METIERTKRRLDTAENLHSVVTTMKSLASINIRQFERATESLEEYNRTVVLALRALLMRGAARDGKGEAEEAGHAAALVFGSDQGMCGQLNDRIVSHALSELENMGVGEDRRMFMVIGRRAASFLDHQGYGVDESLSVPASAEDIAHTAQEIVMVLDQWNREPGLGQVALFHSMHLSGASYSPHTARILPLASEWLKRVEEEEWPTNQVPLFREDPSRLLDGLTRQYIFVSLYRALAQSLASENASRLAAMQGAEKNIEERERELESRYHRQRQMAITEELLDIVSGYDTLSRE